MNTLNQQVLIILVAVLLLGAALFFLINFLRRKSSGLNVEKYRAMWQSIEKSVDQKSPVSYQMAVLSADKLLDQAMRDCKIPGETMGEMLKSARNRFDNIDDVWFAHKLRNRIAHDVDTSVNLLTAKKALAIFKSALKELGAM